MMMTAIKKSQIVAATVVVIAMSAVATPSHARTVKAAAKKTTTTSTVLGPQPHERAANETREHTYEAEGVAGGGVGRGGCASSATVGASAACPSLSFAGRREGGDSFATCVSSGADIDLHKGEELFSAQRKIADLEQQLSFLKKSLRQKDDAIRRLTASRSDQATIPSARIERVRAAHPK